MTKMPECYFYSKFGECSNKECPFLHIDPESKIKDCPWYDRGFCKHGPLCRHRHTRRVTCVNYLVGFCPEGPSCKFMHPRFELPMGTTEQPPLPQQTQPPSKQRAPQVIGVMQSQNSSAGNRGPRPLEQVTCYKVSLGLGGGEGSSQSVPVPSFSKELILKNEVFVFADCNSKSGPLWWATFFYNTPRPGTQLNTP
uniref:Cleavage and polyadenylation specificity factor subunit 4 n=1 Tax=Myotis myotis TaxID=51298 RepID=A0A7J7XYD7_MYOMY|nr:cleavage and polyadenylation specific factor 4 [Myotis myotis]